MSSKQRDLPVISCGIAAYVLKPLKVLLVHATGESNTTWGFPKGRLEQNETYLGCAKREFEEETGLLLPVYSEFIDLGESVKKRTEKIIHIYAVKMTTSSIKGFQSNLINNSLLPEIDEICYFTVGDAFAYIKPEQGVFLDRLQDYIVNA
jgi:predicted NUDIX family NTP pyrophosphohydrolase